MAGGDAAGDNNEDGPMWGKFFDSIGHDDNDSMISGSHVPSRSHFSHGNLSYLQHSPLSDLHPNDSASVVEDDDRASALSNPVNRKGVSVPVPIQADDGTYVFKFRTPSGRTHRFQSRHDDVSHLREIVSGKLAIDPFFTEFQAGEGIIHPDPTEFILSYTDADGDTVLITSDDDVTDAVKIARTAGHDRVVLYVQGGRGWKEVGVDKSEEAQESIEKAKVEEKEVDRGEMTATPPEKQPSPTFAVPAPAPAEQVFGISKDLLLPASIGALAVVIIGVFTISRLTSNNS